MTDTSKQWIKDAARELLGEIGPDRLVPESYKQIWLDKVESVIAKHAPKEEVDTSKERAAFEKWFLDEGLPDEDAEYCQQFWRGWLARAEQSTEASPTIEQRDCQWRRELSLHWLTGIECNHSNKTDKSSCACGWADSPRMTVGTAVKSWVSHVQERVSDSLPQELAEAPRPVETGESK